MELVRKKRKISDVFYGSVVYIEDSEDTSNKKEKMYMVLDDTFIQDYMNKEEFLEKYNISDYVLVADLNDGCISFCPDDTLVEVIDAKLELDY